MAEEQDEVAPSRTELLAIAKVAMPDFLFASDPRVHRARQLIATREQCLRTVRRAYASDGDGRPIAFPYDGSR